MINNFQYFDEFHGIDQPNILVPLIIELFNPTSVIDIGCGVGNWLLCFKNAGVHQVLGVDGDYVDRERLFNNLNANEFYPYNLENELNLGTKFDLVISLEVAEHLSEVSADIFIQTLINHSDTIIFSAAIPNQGGQGHLNEQYISYWKEKFEKKGYKYYDPFRKHIWQNDKLLFWYKQNIVVFSTKNYPQFDENPIIDIVHPEMFQAKQRDFDMILNKYRTIVTGKSGVINSLKILIKSLKYLIK